MMRVNRKSMTIALVGLAMVGAVAAGGVATAATTAPVQTPAAAAICSGDGQFGYGMAVGANAPIVSAATYLGVTQADLQTRLQSGKSLADVAKSQGKSVTGLEAAMVAAVKVDLDADTTLTAAQKTARLALVRSEIATMVAAVHTPGDGMGMSAGMGSDEMGAGMLTGSNCVGVGVMGMHSGN